MLLAPPVPATPARSASCAAVSAARFVPLSTFVEDVRALHGGGAGVPDRRVRAVAAGAGKTGSW